MDNMNGDGWKELLTVVGVTTFRPYDVSFDAMGRIYFANDDGTDKYIVRIDNINGDNPIYITSTTLTNMRCVVVDRINNLVYFSDGTRLARSNLDGTGAVELDRFTGITTLDAIRGMDFHENGILYIAGDTGAASPSPRVFRYDPSTQIVTAAYGPGNLIAPWDVLVKQDDIYVANANGLDGWKIIRLDLDLSTAQGFGNNATSSTDTTPGNFFGPRRFIALSTKKIYLVNDSSAGIGSPFEEENIVSMDNVGTWDNWDTFQPTDIGKTPFRFYGC